MCSSSSFSACYSKECFYQILLHSCEDCHLSLVSSSYLFQSWVIPFSCYSVHFWVVFISRSSEGHHFRRFFVLSFQLSSSILLNCCLFVRLSIIRCLVQVFSQVAHDLFILRCFHAFLEFPFSCEFLPVLPSILLQVVFFLSLSPRFISTRISGMLNPLLVIN